MNNDRRVQQLQGLESSSPKAIQVIEPTTIKLRTLIAKGDFASVYEGIWEQKLHGQKLPVRAIAAKHFKASVALSDMGKQKLLEELAVLSELSHPNLVPLFGVYQRKSAMYVITGLMYKDLDYILHGDSMNLSGGESSDASSASKLLPAETVLRVVRDISEGMNYLEAKNATHRNLKSKNIFAREPDLKHFLIGDFGLSETHKSTLSRLSINSVGMTTAYTAPEVIENPSTAGLPADMYSASVLFWEVVAGKRPWHIKNGGRLEVPPVSGRCPDFLVDIIRRSFEAPTNNLRMRPTFQEVLDMLDKHDMSMKVQKTTSPHIGGVENDLTRSITSNGDEEHTVEAEVEKKGNTDPTVYFIQQESAHKALPPRQQAKLDEELYIKSLELKLDRAEVTDILKRGANPNAHKSPTGWTTLHRVACNDNYAIIGILMDAGADIYAKDNIGSTPLHTASFYGREASIQALLEGSSTGQSLILKDKRGQTALHLAAWYGHHRIIQLLLGAGAHIDAQRNGGYTPLHLASLWGKEDAVRELLKGGPDLEIKEEKDGYTALHMAAVYGHNAVIALLLKAGAQLYAKDIRGRTPLDAAKDHGKDETAKQLRQ